MIILVIDEAALKRLSDYGLLPSDVMVIHVTDVPDRIGLAALRRLDEMHLSAADLDETGYYDAMGRMAAAEAGAL